MRSVWGGGGVGVAWEAPLPPPPPPATETMNPVLLLTLAALLCVLPAQGKGIPMKDFDLEQ
ncbi:hypothetical protein CRUP_020681, partial [Coryphaenoides rupestris]